LLKGVNFGYSYSKSNNNGQSEDSGSVFWFADNMPSIYPLFWREADGSIIQDPVYGVINMIMDKLEDVLEV
jgi:hypothetical protein